MTPSCATRVAGRRRTAADAGRRTAADAVDSRGRQRRRRISATVSSSGRASRSTSSSRHGRTPLSIRDSARTRSHSTGVRNQRANDPSYHPQGRRHPPPTTPHCPPSPRHPQPVPRYCYCNRPLPPDWRVCAMVLNQSFTHCCSDYCGHDKKKVVSFEPSNPNHSCSEPTLLESNGVEYFHAKKQVCHFGFGEKGAYNS